MLLFVLCYYKYIAMENIEILAKRWIGNEVENIDVSDGFYCKNRDIFQAKLDAMVSDLLSNKKIEEDKIYIIAAIAGEIGNNSFDHNLGNWPNISGIFFGYEYFKDKLVVVLADRGRGVLATLRKVRPYIENDKEALRVAFTEKISGRAPEDRGNGLKFVASSVKNFQAYLDFYSGKAKVEANKALMVYELNELIQGCLAIISAKLTL